MALNSDDDPESHSNIGEIKGTGNVDAKLTKVKKISKKKSLHQRVKRYWQNDEEENNENSAMAVKQPNDKSENKVEEYIIDPEKLLKYSRGNKVNTKKVKDKKLKSKLNKYEETYKKATVQAARSELLLPEESGFLEAEGLEKTYKFKQKEISDSVDITSAGKFFELKLDKFGPYKINYSRNGKFLLIGGQKGHLATMDWTSKKLGCEVHVQETVRDVRWLHQETLFAAAQKKNVYIYDNTGLEIHCLKRHREVNKMEFLPYHFLLATVGNKGFLKYQDTSTGKMVAEMRTRLGKCDCMTQNPYNAIIHLGHYNGTVTLWSPTVKEPLVKMLTHRGPVLSMAFDSQGLYMVTSGLDGLMKIWDIRTYKPLESYRLHRAAHSIAISQKGLLAAGFGPHVYIYQNAFTEKHKMPYMSHLLPSSEVVSLQFCPYEDVLGVGHTGGFSSLLIPGAGEPNFDALESNPYQTKSQRREQEVKLLLEKIQPELITLDPRDILKVDKVSQAVKDEEMAQDMENDGSFQPRFRKKGKSSSGKMQQRKKGVPSQQKRDKLKKEMLAKKKEKREQQVNEKRDITQRSALDRFTKKPS